MSEETKKEQTTVETVTKTTTTETPITPVAAETPAKTTEEIQVTPVTTETAVTPVNSEVSKETTTSVESKTTGKKQTWWNRFWSALTGAILAVAAMFGITSDQIAEQKENVKEVKTLASEALNAIKAGDVKTATAKLTEAGEVGKEVVSAAKDVVDKAKATDKKDIINTVKESFTSKDKKAVTDAAKQYTDQKTIAKK